MKRETVKIFQRCVAGLWATIAIISVANHEFYQALTEGLICSLLLAWSFDEDC